MGTKMFLFYEAPITIWSGLLENNFQFSKCISGRVCFFVFKEMIWQSKHLSSLDIFVFNSFLHVSLDKSDCVG